MASISAFKGLRYNDNFASKMNCFVSQPYDVIDDSMLAQYHQKSKYNITNLIQSKADDEYPNPYVKAMRILDSWIKKGVLIQDSEPSIYIYRQQFQLENAQNKSRFAFIARGKIEDYSSGVIFPHEHTFQELKIDRLNLLRHTQTNFGQIFMLYHDPNKRINDFLTIQTNKSRPLYDFNFNGNDRHTFWKVSDPDFIQIIIKEIADKQLIIADGHHRYEAAVMFRNEHPEIHNAKYRMMTFVNMADDGLIIFPTHRLLRFSDMRIEYLLKQIWEYFEVKENACDNTLELLTKMGQTAFKDNVFGFYAGNKRFYNLSPNQKLRDIIKKSLKPLSLQRLDVHILHTFLEQLLKKEDCNNLKIDYNIDANDAQVKIDSGNYHCAFYLNPTRIEQIREVSLENEIMPQKSTYFYPKILTGLVFYQLNNSRNFI